MIRQAHLIAVVVSLVIECALILLVVGCAGYQSGSPPKKEDQGHIEATREGQEHIEATASEEETRCQGTRTFQKWRERFTTNDLPGCPNSGLLLGTDKPDNLARLEGDDEIRGLGGKDEILGGAGNDVIYAGPGDDPLLLGDDGPAAGDDVIYGGSGDEEEIIGGNGDDVIYGGDGDDFFTERWDRGRDKLYCGKGKDTYIADKMDYVDSSCEKKAKMGRPVI